MAGSVIGALRVNLGLDSAQFVKGAKQAETTLQKMSLKMVAVGAAITAAIGGAVIEFAKLTRETINVADEISKAAVKIGISTEELSRLRYAADLSGLSFEQLQKGLLILNRNMAGIGGESKKVAEAFARMGIETRNADGTLKSSTEVLKAMADAFAQMPDGAEKSALAMAVLGKSGADMIPLLNGGAAELAKLTEEADRFGIVIDTETGRKAEEFNDNLSRLQGSFSALGTRLAAELLPHLVDFTNWLIKNQGEIVKAVGNFGNFVGGVARMASAVASGVAWMEERFGRLARAISVIINPLSMVVNLATRLGGGAGNSGGPLGQTAGAMMSMGRSAVETAKAMRTLGMEGEGAGKSLGGSVSRGARSASAALRPMREELKQAVDLAKEFRNLSVENSQGGILGGNNSLFGFDATLGEGDFGLIGGFAKAYSEFDATLGDMAGTSEAQTVRIADTFAQMSQRIVGSLQGLTNSIRSGDILGILGGVLDIFTQLGSSGLFGQGLASRINAPRSFNGGGFTGMGARAGGLDGKGGFLAMLHPRESVLDHTKGQGMGGRLHVTVGVDPRSGNLTAFVNDQIAATAPAIAGAGAAMAQGQMAARAQRRIR
jgi:hypothetical protein